MSSQSRLGSLGTYDALWRACHPWSDGLISGNMCACNDIPTLQLHAAQSCMCQSQLSQSTAVATHMATVPPDAIPPPAPSVLQMTHGMHRFIHRRQPAWVELHLRMNYLRFSTRQNTTQARQGTTADRSNVPSLLPKQTRQPPKASRHSGPVTRAHTSTEPPNTPARPVLAGTDREDGAGAALRGSRCLDAQPPLTRRSRPASTAASSHRRAEIAKATHARGQQERSDRRATAGDSDPRHACCAAEETAGSLPCLPRCTWC